MPSWHVAASSEGGLIRYKFPKTTVSFQHRRPLSTEALRAALVFPRAHTDPVFPESTGEECLKHRGRDGIARALASNDTLNEQGEKHVCGAISRM